MVTAKETFHCTTHSPLPLTDRSGRSHCYNCVIEEFQARAYNLARRMLNDWALAEDAVQESLVSGYRAFHQFRGENLQAWIMRIVANTCRDLLRSRKARPDDPPSAISAVDLPSSEESPEDYVERRELNRAIEAGLQGLPEDQRLAILLVDIQGFSYEEAAVSMGCSVGTVKSRISRGRVRLRDFLRQTGELLPSLFRQYEKDDGDL